MIWGAEVSLPPSLSLVPPTDEAAEGWHAPVWLRVLSDEPDAPVEWVLAGAWDGLFEELAAERALWLASLDDDEER